MYRPVHSVALLLTFFATVFLSLSSSSSLVTACCIPQQSGSTRYRYALQYDPKNKKLIWSDEDAVRRGELLRLLQCSQDGGDTAVSLILEPTGTPALQLKEKWQLPPGFDTDENAKQELFQLLKRNKQQAEKKQEDEEEEEEILRATMEKRLRLVWRSDMKMGLFKAIVQKVMEGSADEDGGKGKGEKEDLQNLELEFFLYHGNAYITVGKILRDAALKLHVQRLQEIVKVHWRNHKDSNKEDEDDVEDDEKEPGSFDFAKNIAEYWQEDELSEEDWEGLALGHHRFTTAVQLWSLYPFEESVKRVKQHQYRFPYHFCISDGGKQLSVMDGVRQEAVYTSPTLWEEKGSHAKERPGSSKLNNYEEKSRKKFEEWKKDPKREEGLYTEETTEMKESDRQAADDEL